MNKIILFKKNRINALLFLLSFSMLSSCVSNKKIAYFQDIQSVNQAQLENATKFTEPIIQPDDILSINIFTLNPQSGAIVIKLHQIQYWEVGQVQLLQRSRCQAFW